MRKWIARLFWIATAVALAADFMERRWQRLEAAPKWRNLA